MNMDNSFMREPPANPPVCLSFADALALVMQQVDYQYFAHPRLGHIDPLYKELCLIASEVFVMCPDASVRVNGAAVSLGVVREVFGFLNSEHLKLVYDNFQTVTHKVYNKKAYLRTALYNAVFELESHFVSAGY